MRHIFGLSGGAAIPIFDALVDSSIELILVRHEQGGSHMADGYARVSGQPGVVLVTSGPGATNTVTGLFTAMMDSVPMVVLTGQTVTSGLGKDAFQEADTTGITYPVVKHSYLVKDPNHIPRIVREAFHIATTGRPGPVLIDLPKDVTSAPCEATIEDAALDLPGYRVPHQPDERDLHAAAELLAHSRRPLLLVGHGSVIAGAGPAVTALAERLRAPVVNTLLGKGAVDERHPLNLGMLGMHGTAYANRAVQHCDLIMSLGSRWDDRITGKIEAFCPDARVIHVDIDPAEIGKLIQPDVSILGDARLAAERLLPLVEPCASSMWLQQCANWRSRHPLTYPSDDRLRARHVIDALDRLLHQQHAGDAVVVTDVGQHQMWAAQFIRTSRPRRWLTSGGAGTMGFGLPAAIGAKLARPDLPVWAIVGDGGFQMTLSELATAKIHDLGIKVLLINNHYLGMVRQWQELFFENRLSGVALHGNPDFTRLAQAYGIPAWRLEHPSQIDQVLRAAMAEQDAPCIIDAQVLPEDNVFPMIPAGAPVSDMLIEPPSTPLEKPSGST